MVIKIAVMLLSAVSMVGTAALAQNIINVASNFLTPGQPLPQNCKDQASILRRELSNFELLPARWKWIVVCDDASWQSFLHRIHPTGHAQAIHIFDENFVEAIYASTNLDAGITVLRGTTIIAPDNPLAYPGHVIAHELAHIVLHTTDEEEAEGLALIWIKQREPAYISWVQSKSAKTGGAPSRVKPEPPARDAPEMDSPQPRDPGQSQPGRIDPRANRPTLSETSVMRPVTTGQ